MNDSESMGVRSCFGSPLQINWRLLHQDFGLAKEDPVGGNQWASIPGEQHNQGANLAFADGHAQRFAWRWSRKVSYPPPGYTPIANAADRSDWQRLADATP